MFQKLCRAHEKLCCEHDLVCCAHKIVCCAHKIVSHAHKILCRAHKIIFYFLFYKMSLNGFHRFQTMQSECLLNAVYI